MATLTSPPIPTVHALAGGEFLIADITPADVFTPEDFTEEQRQVAATAERFMTDEVLPVAERCEHKEPALMVSLLRKAAELGFLGVLVPEKYDGLELDMTTQMIICEQLGRYASFSTTYGAHSGIGTLPLVFFGTHEQKQRYLPTMVSGERIAAYCLSEANAGSDALSARTRAELSSDGSHYILNGEKMWISNGGWADLYTIFAKVDGEKFSAFLVERGMPGVSAGAEENKMGIRGSSTTPLTLENVAVPVENLLGEVGRGHVIAFNILNLGRLKLSLACVGGGKDVLAESIRYAKQRKAFGRSISEFGLIQHKIAEMAIRLFALESTVYRISGMIDAWLAGLSWDDENAAQTALKAVEEYAIECAMAKVHGSETLDYIADEGVQIHGGYGFHQDYMVERSYRDSRINRIFEGTNEINRLLTTGMLLKRVAKGRLDLMSAVQGVVGELAAGAGNAAGAGREPSGEEVSPERDALSNAKKATLFATGVAYQRFGKELESEQEVVAVLSDMMTAVFATESALLRAEKLHASGRGEQAADMVTVLLHDALATIQQRAGLVMNACGEGSALQQNLAAVHKLTRARAMNAVALRRRIAERLLAAEKFVV